MRGRSLDVLDLTWFRVGILSLGSLQRDWDDLAVRSILRKRAVGLYSPTLLIRKPSLCVLLEITSQPQPVSLVSLSDQLEEYRGLGLIAAHVAQIIQLC